MNRLHLRLAALAAVSLIACGTSGCVSYSEVSERTPRFDPVPGAVGAVHTVESLILSAQRSSRRDPMAALGGYLNAARTSSNLLRQNPNDARARADYNFAVARIISTVREAKLDPWTHPLRVPVEGGGWTLAARPDHRANWNPALYQFTAADQFDLKGSYVDKRTVREGLGAPLVAVGKADNLEARRNFSMKRIYYGVTAIARFKGDRCEIGFEDPLSVEDVEMDGHRHPLAADYTVPLAVMLASNDPKKLEIMRVFRPANYAETARIVGLQPYDPNKTVVLVIHGLMDSQATWTPLINTLRGDPEIRKHYQFWFYSYPSGYPYPYSASILRRELDAIEKRYPLRKPMVVVGHSMGGCISRLLITDPGDKLWNQAFGKPPEKVNLSPQNKKLYLDSLVFRSRPEVGRVIFIAAPLKGSDLANHWIGRFASRLVQGPSTLLNAGREAAAFMHYGNGDLVVREIPNSVDTLSPNNRFVKAINAIPIKPGVPYHTIMGDRGKGGAPDCSDGVVPYWSSHMPGAASERVVPSGHSAHQNPEAIQEVGRILKLHLRSGATTKQSPSNP